MSLILSPKYKDFFRYNKARVEGLEGTTAAGKTTVGTKKFIMKVAMSDKEDHILAAQNLGVAEKNIINAAHGLIEEFGEDIVEYNSRGKGNITMPHIRLHCPDKDRIIYVVGYDNMARWKNILGGQYGCCYIDEINTADMAFVRQIMMRNDYLMYTLNPDDPDKEIYKELINRCRPLKKYANDAPAELLKCLDEPAEPGWVWWYFDFDDNWGLTEEKKEQIKSSHTPGTVDYKHYILGIRGKSQGVIFDNFSVKTHTLPQADLLKIAKNTKDYARRRNIPDSIEYFTKFTSGMDTAYSSKSDDTVAMTFLGITNKKRLILIDELVLNNRDRTIPFAPSDIMKMYVEFLDKNRLDYGDFRDVFIDSADQATITEAKKYKRNTGCIYNFWPAYKQKLKIIDRIILMKGWIARKEYMVCETCKEHIKELQVYSWSEKGTGAIPEDANNHTIDSCCYGWIPYKSEIGG